MLKRYLPEVADGLVPVTLFDREFAGDNMFGNNEVKELFGKEKIFSYPKPTKLIKRLIQIGSSENDIILDFFSGSATTAHATLQLNAEDGGNRKYIMVQLPEKIDKDKPAYEEGYRTIDEIGRARIKKAAEKIKKETNADIDYGYKLFRLEKLTKKTIDTIVEFDPHETFIYDDMTELFSFNGISGRETILYTWLNMDGYGLTAHEALVLYNSEKTIPKDFFNVATLKNFIIKFQRWMEEAFLHRFSYKKVGIEPKETALTDINGNVKEYVVQGNIGMMRDEDAKVPDNFFV